MVYSKMIGLFGSYPVYYYPELDYLVCKNQKCKFSKLHACVKNDIDIQQVPDSEITVEKRHNLIILGCIEDTREHYNELRKEVLRARSEYIIKLEELKIDKI